MIRLPSLKAYIENNRYTEIKNVYPSLLKGFMQINKLEVEMDNFLMELKASPTKNLSLLLILKAECAIKINQDLIERINFLSVSHSECRNYGYSYRIIIDFSIELLEMMYAINDMDVYAKEIKLKFDQDASLLQAIDRSGMYNVQALARSATFQLREILENELHDLEPAKQKIAEIGNDYANGLSAVLYSAESSSIAKQQLDGIQSLSVQVLAENEYLQHNLASIEPERIECKKQIKTLQDKLTTQGEELNQLKHNLGLVTTTVSSLMQNNTDLTRENLTLKNQVHQLTQTIETLNQRIPEPPRQNNRFRLGLW